MTKAEENFNKLKEQYGENVELFAVYGTLRKGYGNHTYILKGTPLVGLMKTEPKYVMYHLGGFPGVQEVDEGEEGVQIYVEIYAVSDERTKKSLDSLEGYRGEEFNDPSHPVCNFYNKAIIPTPWGNAYMYIYNGGKPKREGSIVETGNWLDAKGPNAYTRYEAMKESETNKFVNWNEEQEINEVQTSDKK